MTDWRKHPQVETVDGPPGPWMSNGEWSPCFSRSPTGLYFNSPSWTLSHFCRRSKKCSGIMIAPRIDPNRGGPVKWSFPRPRLPIAPEPIPYVSTVSVVA